MTLAATYSEVHPSYTPRAMRTPAKPSAASRARSKGATITDLRSALPRTVSDGFLLACVEGGLSVAQAKAMHSRGGHSNARPKAPGSAGLPDRKSNAYRADLDHDPDFLQARGKAAQRNGHEFVVASKTYARENGCTLDEAQSAVASERPELYDSYRELHRVSES